jgi:hypothetical protein
MGSCTLRLRACGCMLNRRCDELDPRDDRRNILVIGNMTLNPFHLMAIRLLRFKGCVLCPGFTIGKRLYLVGNII